MVGEFLRVRIRQPREAAHRHAHRKILPLDIGRADVLRVGVSFDPRLNDASAFSRAIATLHALGSFAIQLHKLGIVNVGTERALNSLQIGPVAVRSELDTVSEA